MISKKRILITLSDDDILMLDKLSDGYSRSTTISLAITALMHEKARIQNLERQLFPIPFKADLNKDIIPCGSVPGGVEL